MSTKTDLECFGGLHAGDFHLVIAASDKIQKFHENLSL